MGLLPKIIFTDEDGLAQNEDPALLAFEITRKNVASGDYAGILSRLHVLTDNAENVQNYRESMVLYFSGYDDDPRELVEIPEVRAYMKMLVGQWPHFLWYLARGAGAITMLMTLLCDVHVTRVSGGIIAEYANNNQVKDVLQDMLTRGNALHQTYYTSETEVVLSAESAILEVFHGPNA